MNKTLGYIILLKNYFNNVIQIYVYIIYIIRIYEYIHFVYDYFHKRPRKIALIKPISVTVRLDNSFLIDDSSIAIE